jgi:signal recognition particle receptor subunit beta
MVLFNYSTRELTAKIVYYGPGICGKTTNLQYIHENLPGDVRGKMLSLATKTDRTLFFDFLPIDLGEIRGMKTRVQLYTVPGQVFYNETRKLVLKGVDGVVFVADSQETMAGANVESFKNLEDNLKAHGMKLADIPHVIQFNKRDLPKLSSIEELNGALNRYNAPFYESVATTGIGVQDTLKAIVKLVLLNLTKKYETKSAAEAAAVAAQSAPQAIAAAHATASRVAPPAPRASAQAAVAAEIAPPPAPAPPKSIPLSPVEPPKPSRAAAPPAKKPRKAAKPPEPTIAPFGEEEIDGLVGEVEEVAPSIAAASAPAPLAVPAPVVAPPAAEEGAWMGEPGEDEVATSVMYGETVPLEEILDEAPMRPAAAAAPIPSIPLAPPASFEVDRGFDPEWSVPETPVERVAAAPAVDMTPIAPFPIPVEGPEEDVVLTEVASDADLFADPTLDIARLADGEAREILVPVMLGEGPSARRYKLAIRLRLDAVD